MADVSWVNQLVSYIAGFASAILAEPIRKALFKAALNVSFEGNANSGMVDNSFIARTPIIYGDRLLIKDLCYYIRLKVTNRRLIIAEQCRAYLTEVEIKDSDGSFRKTVYSDSIQLAWSCQGNNEESFSALNIAKGLNQYVDVLSIHKGDEGGKAEPVLGVVPLRYEGLFATAGIYRLTIQVVAGNANPEIIRLILEWQGKWDSFRAYRDK